MICSTERKECTGIDPSWSNVIAPYNDFPVAAGTYLTLACEEPYEVKGDNYVTCVEGTTFSTTTGVPSAVPYCEGKNSVYF